ncbi:MAG TPA: hypothetical protein VJ420_06010 [Candidatus Udaeobacter sp.]|nr:hypothetical protein [Candidatus Udaeobacter sp.]
MIRTNCRARFTAADFDFIVRTLARSQTDQVSLVDLLSDVETRDSENGKPKMGKWGRSSRKMGSVLTFDTIAVNYSGTVSPEPPIEAGKSLQKLSVTLLCRAYGGQACDPPSLGYGVASV